LNFVAVLRDPFTIEFHVLVVCASTFQQFLALRVEERYRKSRAENVSYLLPNPVVGVGAHGVIEFRDSTASCRLDLNHLVFGFNGNDLPTPACEDQIGVCRKRSRDRHRAKRLVAVYDAVLFLRGKCSIERVMFSDALSEGREEN